MVQLRVITREGVEHHLTGKIGRTVMENIREGGIDEVMAICGGCCSCATCHVYVDPVFEARLSLPTEEESDLLEASSHRRPESRLSCQIPFGPDLDGLRVTIAPED